MGLGKNCDVRFAFAVQEHLQRSGLFRRGSSDRAHEDRQRDGSRLGGHQLASGRRNGLGG